MTDTQIAIFLTLLEQTGVVATSAKKAGVSTRAIHKMLEDTPGFEEQYNDAIEAFNDTLEAEAIRRARDGVVKDVYHRGEVVGSQLEYSDALMSKLLTGRRPKVYGDKKEISGANGGAITVKILDFADEEFL